MASMASTAGLGGSGISAKLLEYLYHHLFMPMRLPQTDDWNEKHEDALIQLVTTGLKSLKGAPGLAALDRNHLQHAIQMLEATKLVHADGVTENDIRSHLKDLANHHGAVALHLTAQNAGLLISNSKDGQVRFEQFELSPRNSSVMNTSGRLRRVFPTTSVAIPVDTARHEAFIGAVAQGLSSLANSTVNGQQPTARKAGTTQAEFRDTTHPGMVTEVFSAFLSAAGTPAAPPGVAKRTRDEVLWDKVEKPWRRSPRWLLIRVSLQLLLSRAAGRMAYKRAMLVILANVAEALFRHLPQDAMLQKDPLYRDMLHVMVSKLARRLLKLRSTIEKPIQEKVRDIMDRLSLKLKRAWQDVQRTDIRNLNLQALANLDFKRDTTVFLSDLEGFIKSIGEREASSLTANFMPKSVFCKLAPDSLPAISTFMDNIGEGVNAVSNLFHIEQWVCHHLRSWVDMQSGSSEVCDLLRAFLENYHALALKHYRPNPEALSAMYLTILEVWIAMDQAATLKLPLLRQYKVGVDRGLLQSLLLPTQGQLKRLAAVERYLEARTSAASLPFSLTCGDVKSHESFAVKYYDASPELRGLHGRINARAEKKKEEKLSEFDRLKSRYDELMHQWSTTECEYYEARVYRGKNIFYETRHSRNCSRHAARREAQDLGIVLHEDPLPLHTEFAKVVVFELSPPSRFGTWRDCTLFVMRNVLKGQYQTATSTGPETRALRDDPHLQRFVADPASYRVSLASGTKANVQTHRSTLKISHTRKQDVCLPTGFMYRYYDSAAHAYISDVENKTWLANELMYLLPTRSQALQSYLKRPPGTPNGPSQNKVIADQSNTPYHMTLEEYVRLCTVPLGYALQWHNIMMELEAPSIDFKKEETILFILQCIYQVGPASGRLRRAAHHTLADEQYGFDMLKSLTTALTRIKANWESAPALGIFSTITNRLLELTESTKVAAQCVSFLDSLRGTAFGWVNLLRKKAERATTDVDRLAFRKKSVDTALICALCADVHGCILDSILGDSDTASIVLQCSIVIQEGKHTYSLPADPVFALLQHRYYRLLARAIPVLIANKRGVEKAVARSWAAYCPGYDWDAVSEHWLTTKTEVEGYNAALTVHYNILSGELLVQGEALGRPADVFEKHSMWRILFGDSVIAVMPTILPGFIHSAKRQHFGYTISLGLTKAKDLLLRAVKDGKIYELLPSSTFRDKYPEAFIKDFVHFYNVTDDVVELRPIEDPWTPASVTTWILCRLPMVQRGWNLINRGSTVVGSQSPTAKSICDLLSPLADRQRIHCVLSPYGAVEIEIPTIRVGFSLKAAGTQLWSREARDFVIDARQAIGTLIGLKNKLVLKHFSSNSTARIVFVPEGKVSYDAAEGHVKVSVLKHSVTTVYRLGIDDKLGRLIDNGSLQGKIYLAYLHTLTSSSLPDPLINKTGTEQALTILNSAALKSFEQLDNKQTEILVNIARITPGRCFYPSNLHEMQTVTWNDSLSTFSQHNSLLQSVTSIFNHAERNNVFFAESIWPKPSLGRTDLHLMRRDAIRSSAFRVDGFGAQAFTTTQDKTYNSRDAGQSAERCWHANRLAVSLRDGVRHYKTPSAEMLWDIVANHSTINGPTNPSRRQPIVTDAASLVNDGLDPSLLLPILKALGGGSGIVPLDFGIHQLMLWLSYLSCHATPNIMLLQMFAALCRSKDFRTLSMPKFELARPVEGYEVTKSKIELVVYHYLIPLAEAPEADYEKLGDEELQDFDNRQQGDFKLNQSRAVDSFVKAFYDQRHLALPRVPDFADAPVEVDRYIQLDAAIDALRDKFKAWSDNHALFRYFQDIATIAINTCVVDILVPPWPPLIHSSIASDPGFISSASLLSGDAPILPPMRPILKPTSSKTHSASGDSRLHGLLNKLDNLCGSQYEKKYASELRESLVSLARGDHGKIAVVDSNLTTAYLAQYLEETQDYARKAYDCLVSSIRPSSESCALVFPRISPIWFLQYLDKGDTWEGLADGGWKQTLIDYAMAITESRRAERMFNACRNLNRDELVLELDNSTGANWDPREHPEWLLLEVESELTIRRVQIDIAKQMASPTGHHNAVLQLIPGSGKSSVIIPLASISLGNRQNMIEVVVNKPQSQQMLTMLTSKLGNLVGRPVYFLPVSRALRLDQAAVQSIRSILEECQKERGILLVQPEFLLSFKLMSIEASYLNEGAVADSLIAAQDFLHRNARAIVDECDEVFSPRFELIYTMGAQSLIEGGSSRWACVQEVLELVRTYAPQVAAETQDMEVISHVEGAFPRTRVLQQEVEDLIVAKVADHVCSFGVSGFPISRTLTNVRQAVKTYITKAELSSAEIAAVEDRKKCPVFASTAKTMLWLLRGLLAGGVLCHTLRQKRWRVQYGLADMRPTKLAVPYTAKDAPSARSEYSHPDIVLCLTSLCYYYGGLSNDDLVVALSHLMCSDQAVAEYRRWMKDAPGMPTELRSLDGVNLRDRQQCEDVLFPNLRFAKAAVDYFLSHIVFSKEMRQFEKKLAASGWDIGEVTECNTTGFSGTNDSKSVLPLAVHQLDLPMQKHTNALLLEHLLNQENTVMSLPRNREKSDAITLLETVFGHCPAIRVLLDAGALVLELDSRQVARQWLQMSENSQIKGCVFVDEHDIISVLDRKGHEQELRTSPFASQLDACLVFLDQQHTRGIDLVLPRKYRAAVTLGAGLTKDALVQACMRMRQLGKGQCVTFVLNQEMENRIRNYSSIPAGENVSVEDVILFSIFETWVQTKRAIPLWASQGQRNLYQQGLWKAAKTNGVTKMSAAAAKLFLEDEAQSIEYRYRPKTVANDISQIIPNISGELVNIRDRCLEFSGVNFNAGALQEEQERQLAPEMECQRSVQRPHAMSPAISRLHPDVAAFMSTGAVLTLDSNGYLSAFQSLQDTSAAADMTACKFATNRGALLVTKEFCTSVITQGKKASNLDAYQRPVQWLLTRQEEGVGRVERIMIISPFEAQHFMQMPAHQRCRYVTLHLYKSRCNAVHSAFDDLGFFTFPRLAEPVEVSPALIDDLNLCAGQLYFRSYSEYARVCAGLHLATGNRKGKEVHDAQGYIRTDEHGKRREVESPVAFLRILMSTIRRQGTSISKTHIGEVLDGKILQESDFE